MKRCLVILTLLVLAGCSGVVIPTYPVRLVVEGWIENGRSPVVMVTTTVPVSEEPRDIASLEENVVRWATVSVSDGEKEVFLTGKIHKNYFPPYIYTTAMMSGEPGRTYTLKVRYGGQTVTAETVIPDPVELEYIKAEKVGDENYTIRAGLKDRKDTKDYYKFFTKVIGKDSLYKSSFLGLIDDVTLDDDVSQLQVFNGFNPSTVQKDTLMHFKPGDRVGVRFCTMGEDEFHYWEDFDDVASLSLNPFFPVSKKIRSNIKGGLGYWAGYGSTYYYLTCE